MPCLVAVCTGMGRIKRGHVGMPKIKKTKVVASSEDKKATAEAKKMPTEPPPPDSPAKPTHRSCL